MECLKYKLGGIYCVARFSHIGKETRPFQYSEKLIFEDFDCKRS